MKTTYILFGEQAVIKYNNDTEEAFLSWFKDNHDIAGLHAFRDGDDPCELLRAYDESMQDNNPDFDTIPEELFNQLRMLKDFPELQPQEAPSQTIDYWEKWLDVYDPLPNHISHREEYNNCMFETYGDDFIFIEAFSRLQFQKHKGSEYIWTLTEDQDGRSMLVQGFLTVNRFCYFLVSTPFHPDLGIPQQFYEHTDEEEQELNEEHEPREEYPNFDEDEFLEWEKSDNVIKGQDGIYRTQDAQYSIPFKTIDELRTHYKKQYCR